MSKKAKTTRRESTPQQSQPNGEPMATQRVVRNRIKHKVEIVPRSDNQADYINKINDTENTIVFGIGAAGTGKAQPLDSKILTPEGWTEMGNMQVGSKVITPCGDTATVTGVFPQGIKDIYKITFKDGRVAESCLEHLWNVYSPVDKEWKTLSLFEIINTSISTGHGTHKLKIQLIDPVDGAHSKLPIDPWLLGHVLALGANSDLSSLPSYVDVDASLVDSLSNLGLGDEEHLFVPSQYKEASLQQLKAIIRGLLDGKATITKKGRISITVSSEQLAKDIQEMIWSIGGICKLSHQKHGYKCSISYSNPRDLVSIHKFADRLPAKHDTELMLDMMHIEFSRKAAAQCIMVDHPEHLYITDNYITTHNTLLATLHAIKGYKEGLYDKIVITRPAVSTDEEYGFLPGTLVEKVAPWCRPVLDIFAEYYHPAEINSMIEDGILELSPLGYMRGRAEPLTNLIPTPSGYVPMGDIKLGDQVLGSDGTAITVTGVFPQGVVNVVEIKFSDGTVIETSDDHLWSVKYDGRGYSVHSVKELMEMGLRNEDGSNRFSIPLVKEPIALGKAYHGAYELGLSLSQMDLDLENQEIVNDLLQMNIDSRIDLLRGMFDKHLVLTKHAKIDYNIKYELRARTESYVKNVKLIIESLGGIAPVTNMDGGFTVEVRLSNKHLGSHLNSLLKVDGSDYIPSDKITRTIESIDYIESKECQCISVDADDMLYLTNHYTVTHNTFKKSIIIFDEAQNSAPDTIKMALTRIGEGSRMLVTGDVNQFDRKFKEENGLKDIIGKVKDTDKKRGIAIVEFNNSDIKRHPIIDVVLGLYDE